MFRIKRVYEPYEASDGKRVLVDRLWPRGMTREAARLDEWAKELSPSDALRKWYGHDPAKWDEFRERYAAELADRQEALDRLAKLGKSETVTLLYSSREAELNNAAALRQMLERRLS